MKDCFTKMDTGIRYKRHGDHYLPDVMLPPQKKYNLTDTAGRGYAISKGIGILPVVNRFMG